MSPDHITLEAAYRRHTRHQGMILVLLGALVLLLAVGSLTAGSATIPLPALVQALVSPDRSPDALILWNLRIPRTVAAIVAGAGLALAGCVMQNVLRNPMASPATLGVSHAAVFGVNLAIIVCQTGTFSSADSPQLTHPYSVTAASFLAALSAILLILLLARRHGFPPETIVLAGVALGALFSAGTTILQFFALDTQIATAVFWTFGDLGRVTHGQNAIMATATLTAAVVFFLKRWDFNALMTGEEFARSLGVRTQWTRFLSLLLASLLCAVTVTFLGIIGFVGLVAPQLIRRVIGNDHRFLLPAAALAGAALLLSADIIARLAIKGTVLPVGAVTSLFGGPIFLWILLKRQRRHRP